jgi:hypothetical protein
MEQMPKIVRVCGGFSFLYLFTLPADYASSGIAHH